MNPSRETKFSGTLGDREYYFLCSADHEQDWQPYPVDPYSAICYDHTYIHTHTHGNSSIPCLVEAIDRLPTPLQQK